MDAWRKAVVQFLFQPATDTWLAVLRLGLGFQVTAYVLSLARDWIYLFGSSPGSLDVRELMEALLSLEGYLIPRLGWLINAGTFTGISEKAVLYLAWFCLFCAGCCLLVGLACRFSALLAWFLHLCASSSGGVVTYGVDSFMTIGLFYLVLSPLPDRYSLDWRLRNRRPNQPHLLGFFCRALQLHLSIIYFFSGLTKILGAGWWDGSNIWRALIQPPFNVVPPEILVRWKWLFPTVGLVVCLIELGYPVFIWLKQTRLWWLLAVVGMHLAIGIAMGMYLFALIMIVLNVAAFGPAGLAARRQKTADADGAMITSSA